MIFQISYLKIQIENLFQRLTSYFESCQTDCEDMDGHLPYFYEVESILSQLFVNNTIDDLQFPIFTADFRRHSMEIGSSTV